MSDVLAQIRSLVARGEVDVSAHGFRELAADGIVLVGGFHEAQKAMRRKTVELVREGKYAVEVPIDLILEEGGWSPYFSLQDAKKLETVRLALQRRDLAEAAKYGRLFELLPVSA